MNLAIVKTRSTVGIFARSVSVEVHLQNGLPAFHIVGLPEIAIKESKDRVRSAIINSHFEFPCRRIVVSLAPADLPKSGSGFDLPIAIGILAASGQIPLDKLDSHEFIGELALDGRLRGIAAILPTVLATHREEQQLIIPKENAEEASLSNYSGVLTADHLLSICQYLCQNQALDPLPTRQRDSVTRHTVDLSEVKGQYHAKRALEIAACGGHSLLLSGPPGSGKTMLAKRFITLLPILSETEALECAAINSIHGRLPDFEQWRRPPFRAPHHTASHVALVGGGNPPKPGEISLAHHGVLFLDELPEFSRQVLETLREPLESGTISIARAANQIEYPAQFQLIAAMNPCPCGHWGNPKSTCLCSPERIKRYLSKLSGPLLDRIDIQITVQALSEEDLITPHIEPGQESERIRILVEKHQQQQLDRQGCSNASLTAKACESVARLGEPERQYLHQIMQRFKLSARGFHRLLKVARTIADLREAPHVERPDLQQALSFRQSLHPPQ